MRVAVNHITLFICVVAAIITAVILWGGFNNPIKPSATLFSESEIQTDSPLQLKTTATSVTDINPNLADQKQVPPEYQPLANELEALEQKSNEVTGQGIEDQISEADELIKKTNRLITKRGLDQPLSDDQQKALREKQANLKQRIEALSEPNTQ